jgi:hypothetical protein
LDEKQRFARKAVLQVARDTAQSCLRTSPALYADLDEVFREWRWSIRAIADGGDRIAVRADFVGYGRSSGVEAAVNDGGTAVMLSDRGRVAWQEWFAEQDGWTKALEAVGLRE